MPSRPRPPGWGPTIPIRHGYFEQRFFTVHGGAAGEALYWAATTLFQRLGAQILAVLMFASGLLLLTGTTVAGLMSRAGRVARTAGTGTRDLAKTVRSGGPGLEGLDPRGDEIAITRNDPTEPLGTDVLGGEPDAGEVQPGAAADQRHGEWAEEEIEGPEIALYCRRGPPFTVPSSPPAPPGEGQRRDVRDPAGGVLERPLQPLADRSSVPTDVRTKPR